MLVLVLFQALLLAAFATAQTPTPTMSMGYNSTTTPSNSTNNSTSPNSPGKYPLTTDGQCGSGNGRMCLVNGTSPCCSSGGYCGNTDEYCQKPACQDGYGKCQSNDPSLDFPECSWANEGTSPRCDGKCGSAWNNAVCSSDASPDAFVAFGVYDYGRCCSSAGFCGSTPAHCGSGCQSGCADNNSTQSSSSSAAPPAAASTSASAAEHIVVLPSGIMFAFFSAVGFMIGC